MFSRGWRRWTLPIDTQLAIFNGWEIGNLTSSLGSCINQSDQVTEIPRENKLVTERSTPRASPLAAQVLRGNRLVIRSQKWRPALARPAHTLGRTDLPCGISIWLTIPFWLVSHLQTVALVLHDWIPMLVTVPSRRNQSRSLGQTCRVLPEEPRIPSLSPSLRAGH